MDLFDQNLTNDRLAPLAERMRPRNLDEVVGQEHLIGKGKLLRQMVESDKIYSVIFFGPPGAGKTTLARVIASATKSDFVAVSAVSQGVKDVRSIIERARETRKYHQRRTVLFVDEIHRWNKAVQDALLPACESGDVVLIGATTENPSFEVNSALLSRSRVLVIKPLSHGDIRLLLQKALKDERGLAGQGLIADENALDFLSEASSGDARVALNALEIAAQFAEEGHITLETVQESLQKRALRYDRAGEEHYNVISAFIKSVRGSDPDAAIYWLARMIESGEDPLFIARRLVILASEDISNGDPHGLLIAVAAQQAVHLVGMPESRIILAQATTYLASAPKSNASYLAIDAALAEAKKSGPLPVPMHLRNAPTKLMKDMGYHEGYRYPHDFPRGVVKQDYLPEELIDKTYYRPTNIGYEKTIAERLEFWRNMVNKESSDVKT
jgi:putative ATPase